MAQPFPTSLDILLVGRKKSRVVSACPSDREWWVVGNLAFVYVHDPCWEVLVLNRRTIHLIASEGSPAHKKTHDQNWQDDAKLSYTTYNHNLHTYFSSMIVSKLTVFHPWDTDSVNLFFCGALPKPSSTQAYDQMSIVCTSNKSNRCPHFMMPLLSGCWVLNVEWFSKIATHSSH